MILAALRKILSFSRSFDSKTAHAEAEAEAGGQPLAAPANFNALAPVLDRQRGTMLAIAPGVERGFLAVPHARYVDVTAGPTVRVLDLSTAAPGVHITIQQCPQLVELHVPAQEPGAVVHVSFSGASPALSVVGCVADFDAAWGSSDRALDTTHSTAISTAFSNKDSNAMPTARLTAGRSSRGPRQNLWLGPLGSTWPNAELVVLLRTGNGNALHVPADAACRELVLQGLDTITSLQVDRPLDTLEIQLCGALQAVTVAHELQRLRVEQCPALADIDGTGQAVSLARGTGANILTLHGLWWAVRLTNCTPTVVAAPLVAEMDVMACPNLRRVQLLAGSTLRCADVPKLDSVDGPTRLDVDPNSAFEGLRAAVGSNPQVRQALLGSVEEARTPKQILRAMQVLAELTRAGLAENTAWQHRVALYQRSVARPQLGKWAWQFPADLADRGWMSDLRLWLMCRNAVPEAAATEAAIRRAHGPEHLAAVARTLQGTEDQQLRLLLADILLAQLRHGAAHGQPLHLGRKDRAEADGIEARVEQQVQAVLRTCRQLQGEPDMPELLPSLCYWLVRCLPCEEGLQLLAAIRTLGCAQAVEHLATIAAAPEVAPQLRRLAAGLLLGGEGDETI